MDKAQAQEDSGPQVVDKRKEDAPLEVVGGNGALELNGQKIAFTAQNQTEQLLYDLNNQIARTNSLLEQIWMACGGQEASNRGAFTSQAWAERIERLQAQAQAPKITPAFGMPGYKDPGRKGN